MSDNTPAMVLEMIAECHRARREPPIVLPWMLGGLGEAVTVDAWAIRRPP